MKKILKLVVLLGLFSLFLNKKYLAFTESRLDQVKVQLQEEDTKIKNITDEKKIYDEKVVSLEEELSKLESDISTSEIELTKTNQNIGVVQLELEETKKYIDHLEKVVLAKKRLMKEYINSLYSQPEVSLFRIFLSSQNLSDVLGSIKQSSAMQDFIVDSIKIIEQKEKEILQEKDHLFEQETALIELKQLQEDQKFYLENTKKDKQVLLEETKGDQKKYEDLLRVSFEQRKTIINTLNLLGGNSNGSKISIEEAYSLAQKNAILLENKIRPEYLVAVMKVESGLGRSTGSAFYKDALSGCASKEGNKTRINTAREEQAFESIIQKLGLNLTQPVSACPFKDGGNYKAGVGGAMGYAQVMPTTWLGYEKRLQEIKGSSVSPWSIQDSMLAMANILLGKVGNQNINGNLELERKAAMCYVGGCNQAWYADRVMNALQQVELALAINQPEIEEEVDEELEHNFSNFKE